MLRATAAVSLLGLLGCAGAPPATPTPVRPAVAGGSDRAPAVSDQVAPPKPAATAKAGGDESFRPAFQMNEVSEKEWLRATREKLAERLKVEPQEILFSPSKQVAAVLRRLDDPSKKRRGPPPPRRYRIEVLDHQGKQTSSFRPVTARGSDEPPKDLRFLSEDRLVYEVVAPSPPEPTAPRAKAKPTARRKRAARGKQAAARARKTARAQVAAARAAASAPPSEPAIDLGPERLFVIQPIKRGARAKRCAGWRFTFTRTKVEERMAYVGGRPGAAFVSVNGAQVYPRKGRTVIASEPAWSKDGVALAFLERPASDAPRLILLAEFDNPTGDTTWTLPQSTRLEGARVFWAGPGKLVVGRTALKPLFATSFERERPREFSP